jgi:hypothetical protein
MKVMQSDATDFVHDVLAHPGKDPHLKVHERDHWFSFEGWMNSGNIDRDAETISHAVIAGIGYRV